MFENMLDVGREGRYIKNPKNTFQSSNHMHCGRSRILRLTQNALLEKPMPIPKRKRNFDNDVLPMDSRDNPWKK